MQQYKVSGTVEPPEDLKESKGALRVAQAAAKTQRVREGWVVDDDAVVLWLLLSRDAPL